MAISYFETAWNTAATDPGGGLPSYKDLAITGAQVGDLIVVIALAENFGQSGQIRTIVTQAGGTTGAWTLSQPAVVVDNDVEALGGYALVTGAGIVTARAEVRLDAGAFMGVGAFLIPAAEVGATYAWLGVGGNGFVGSANGQFSVTLSANSVTIYGAADWNVVNMGTTPTPAGGVVRRSQVMAGRYSVWLANWTNQAAGTRNYGPSGIAGGDISGVVFRMDTATTGSTGTVTSTLPALTQAAAGTVTAPGRTGTAASTLPALTQSALGEVDAPVITGEAASVLPALTQSATGETTPPTFSGAADSVLPALSQEATGTTSAPVFTGAADSILPGLTQTAAGTVTVPVYSGEIVFALPSLTQQAIGGDEAPQFTGVIDSVLPALVQSGSADEESGSATSTLAPLTQTALGTVSVPVFAGAAVSILPGLTQFLAGTVTQPVYSGSASSTLPSLTQESSGTVTVPVFTGTIVSVLPALAQIASDESGYDDLVLPLMLVPSAPGHTLRVERGVSNLTIRAVREPLEMRVEQ